MLRGVFQDFPRPRDRAADWFVAENRQPFFQGRRDQVEMVVANAACVSEPDGVDPFLHHLLDRIDRLDPFVSLAKGVASFAIGVVIASDGRVGERELVEEAGGFRDIIGEEARGPGIKIFLDRVEVDPGMNREAEMPGVAVVLLRLAAKGGGDDADAIGLSRCWLNREALGSERRARHSHAADGREPGTP